MILLILSGESVFALPFVLQRIFRSTVLEVFQIDNTQLGICFSVYGIVALFSYFLGGPIADRFPPRKLIALALWLTALGGIFYSMFPSYFWLRVIYGYWGFTTIFLFWAPLIKATRVWGGKQSQGKAFGILDGGRGLTGTLIGIIGVTVFAIWLPENPDLAAPEVKVRAFKYVTYYTSVVTAFIGLLVWLFLKPVEKEEQESLEKLSLSQVGEVIKMPAVWMLMLIVMLAYIGYKITDDVSLYAREVMNVDEVVSARAGTLLLFIRAVVGVGVGFIADRFKTTRWLVISFMLTSIGSLLFGLGIASSSWMFFLVSVLIVASGVYAARALYFAVFKEGRIPLIYMGTAVGLVSVIGFTPDIFAGVVMGYLLDTNPGEIGHQLVFTFLGVCSVIGMVVAWMYHRRFGA